ncbi:hypothetical protein [Turicibacter sanguinis]|uniref:hypothetical protein n=1 Tax=Turicibacter sanguinis TaxID=154288 RepID=UPI0021D4D01D|nr:hypothetical protein [Turicibacter sanguinis]MCU7197988.1 hypothetical protein [Turicibacter sanguinis]MDB8576083.1 hypothetical protein [Turicibacter sanguinis]MDB8578888.1 hypothetical protein [Turicibacter sanguinis]MDB8584701.1 hypothetical protein [Turicibacter sanguinis]MDB8587648.1 hypothetical protein [Turicibacter sanguinis]
MPFDITSKKEYYIDYGELFTILNKERILDDKEIQEQYLIYWMKWLKENDDIVVKEMSQNIEYIEKALENEPEIFTQEIFFGSQKILLQFRISYILKKVLSQVTKETILNLDIEEFTIENSSIKWTKTNDIIKDSKKDNIPIILVPYHNGNYLYLLIDGNHRLTKLLRENRTKVDTVILNAQSLVDIRGFFSGFDMYFYAMYNELSYMERETREKKRVAIDLINDSFLFTGILVE